MKRITTVVTVLLVTFSVSVAGALTGNYFARKASATVPASHLAMLYNIPVFATNGYANLPEFSGSGDGVLGASCAGAQQLGGAKVPAIVITRVDPDLTRMRIASWGYGTPVVNGTVNVTCILKIAD